MKYKCIKYLTDWHTLSPTKDDHMSVATSIDGLRLVLDSTDKIRQEYDNGTAIKHDLTTLNIH